MTKNPLNSDNDYKTVCVMDTKNFSQRLEKMPVNAEMRGRKRPDKLIATTMFLTPQQRQELKIRAAIKKKPEEYCMSAIVRAALDEYLY